MPNEDPKPKLPQTPEDWHKIAKKMANGAMVNLRENLLKKENLPLLEDQEAHVYQILVHVTRLSFDLLAHHALHGHSVESALYRDQ